MGTGSSTLTFAQGVRAVRTRIVPLDDHTTWALVFAKELQPFEVHAIIDPASLRFLRRYFPAHLAVLLYKCADQLHLYANDVRDQTKAAKGSAGRDATAVRMALLLLARILPYTLEDLPPADEDSAAEANGAQEHPWASRFAHHFFNEGKTFNDSHTSFTPLETGCSVGQSIINGIYAVACTPSFGIGASQTKEVSKLESHPAVEPGLLWCAGVGSANHATLCTDGASTVTNRLYVMRALQAALTGQVFTPTVHVRDCLRSHATSVTTPHAATFAASLLNTVLQYVPTGLAPYTSHWVTEQENCVFRAAELLVLCLDHTCFYPAEAAASARVVSNATARAEGTAIEGAAAANAPDAPPVEAPVLVADAPASAGGSTSVNQPAESHDTAAPPGTGAGPLASDEQSRTRTMTNSNVSPRHPEFSGSGSALVPAGFVPETSQHAFWSVLQELTPFEADELVRGVVRLMANFVDSRNTFLPGSQRLMPGSEFYFALFWLLIDRCPPFRRSFCGSKTQVRKAIVPLLDFGFQGVKSVHKSPQLQLVIALFTALSADRDFVLALNGPFNEWIPFELQAFTGSYADLLLIAMHSVILKRDPHVTAHHHMVMATVRNLSPYVTHVCPTAAAKLVALLDFLVSPSWLALNPQHPRILENLVAALATFVQYQPSGSSALVYALLRHSDSVRELVRTAHRDDLGLQREYFKSPHVFTLHCATQAADEEVTKALKEDKDRDVVDLLKTVTLVGRLPVPHPIELLRFPPTPASDAWRVSWFWSLVYVHSHPPLVDPASVRVFNIETSRQIA